MGRHKKPTVPPVEIISTSKQRSKRNPDTVYKVCPECGREQPITHFYVNKHYGTQQFRDRWCKSCIKDQCVSEETFRRYMYMNNRLWKPELWQEAAKKATRDLNLSPDFMRLASVEAQEREITARAIECACSIMNNASMYKYVDNESQGFNLDMDAHVGAEKAAERKSEDPYYNQPVYSPAWKGMYTQYEIDEMNRYLDSIIAARGVDDEIGIRYARQFVSQSALVDMMAARQKADPSKENTAAYKEAVSSLEAISRAGQIAPAYKRNDVTVGLGSLGEFIKMMENGQKLGESPAFEPDQIDGMVKDLRHTMAALDGAGGLWST